MNKILLSTTSIIMFLLPLGLQQMMQKIKDLKCLLIKILMAK